jgi:hypothetical protein
LAWELLTEERQYQYFDKLNPAASDHLGPQV